MKDVIAFAMGIIWFAIAMILIFAPSFIVGKQPKEKIFIPHVTNVRKIKG